MIIKEIKAKVIKDSRKEDTIQVLVKTDIGNGIGSAPSGASKSKKEVVDFPKGGAKKSVEIVNSKLNQEFINFEISSFEDLEKVESIIKKYDNTERLEIIGGNAVIALEFAILHALSKGDIYRFLNPDTDKLPRPLGNCIGGGAHVSNGTSFQEFLLLSLDSKSFSSAALANKNIHKALHNPLKKYLVKEKFTDEGAWAPDLTEIEILDILKQVVDDYNKKIDFKVRIGLDIAADSLWDGEYYVYKDKKLDRKQQIKYVKELIEKYNLIYVEDPLEENDFSGFAELTKTVKNKCIICGDDLIATNVKNLEKAIKKKAINGVIVKPNQIGSLIKTKKIIEIAKKEKIYPVISHRSGETTDSTISHLAVAFNVPVIKCGINGKERESKINELKKIESEIKKQKHISKHL